MSNPKSHDALVRALMDVDSYYMALGKFIAKFSEIEAEMQIVLRHFAGVASPNAEALFSGVRVEAASNFITRIADAQKWTDQRKADWKTIADQLSHIRKLRNDIVHYGAIWKGTEEWTVTNKLFAHTEASVTSFPVSSSILSDATGDLEKIDSDLILFTWSASIPDDARDGFEQTRQSAWRYKPPPQAGRSRKSRSRHQRRSRRHPPSQT